MCKTLKEMNLADLVSNDLGRALIDIQRIAKDPQLGLELGLFHGLLLLAEKKLSELRAQEACTGIPQSVIDIFPVVMGADGPILLTGQAAHEHLFKKDFTKLSAALKALDQNPLSEQEKSPDDGGEIEH